jgi:cell division septum initiation protein DivIVA
MTDDTGNLILEQLRIIRSEIRDVRSEIKDVRDRVDSLDTQVQGLTYIVTTAIGALVVDMKEVKRRLSIIEGRA